MYKDKLEEYTLENGISVVTLPRPEKLKATFLVGIKVGSIDETPGINGISHFTEHMLFKSNQHRNLEQLKRDLEWNGIQTNAFTSQMSTVFYASSPKETLSEAIQIAYEASTNLSYEDREIELERPVIITEIKRKEMMLDFYILNELIPRHYFKGTDLERTVTGPESIILELTKDQLLEFKKKHYVPAKIGIAVVGNFDRNEVRDRIESTFGRISSQEVEESKPNLEARLEEEGPFYEEKGNVSQIYFAHVQKATDQFSEDYMVLDLIKHAIGSGFTSRMFRELRDKRGICYTQFCWLNGYPEGILVYYMGGLKEEKLEEARNVLNGIISDIIKEGLSEEELKGFKTKYISDKQDWLDFNNMVAQSLLSKLMFSYPISILDYIDKVKPITNDDIIRVANKYLINPRVEIGLKPKK